MSDVIEVQPQTTATMPQPKVDDTPVGSLTEHVQEYGGYKSESADPGDETDPQHHSHLQRRDRDKGTFREGMKRATKAKATAEDVDAINKWTGELKTAEEAFTDIPRLEGESDRVYTLRRRAELVKRASAQAATVRQLEAEVARLRSQGAPKAEIAKAEAKVERAEAAQPDPEPSEDDPKYGGDYTAFIKEHNKWAAREVLREAREQERQAAEAQRKDAEQREVLSSWASRVEAAKAKYPDFEQVALGPTRIPANSLVDAYVMEDDNGPDLLYHLNKHPEELDGILRLPVLAQSKAIAQILLRLSSPQASETGTTGSVPERRVVKAPPKPPNPVRTEAQRPADQPPVTDGSMSLVQHHKSFPGRRF